MKRNTYIVQLSLRDQCKILKAVCDYLIAEFGYVAREMLINVRDGRIVDLEECIDLDALGF